MIWITLGSAAVGLILGYVIRKVVAQKRMSSLETKAEKILSDAKTKVQEILLEGKNKALTTIEEAKREENRRRDDLKTDESRLHAREAVFDKKLLEIEEKSEKLIKKSADLDVLKEEVQKVKLSAIEKLENVASLSREEAKKELVRNVEDQSKDDLMSRMRKLTQENNEELEKRTKELLVPVIQRMAASVAGETSTSTVYLQNEELKGRIIGKEGRNIKAIENITGVEIVIDETPGSITLSAFSPIRRQVAKMAIEKLLIDGRIHPGRIEEAVDEAKKELAKELQKAGEDALFTLGIPGTDPKLVQILGRLKYRTSYGQPVLQHSIEVAQIAGMLAQELGANVMECKKGGLFHDIGKALDHEIEGTHPELGYNLMTKFGQSPEVARHCISHHENDLKRLEEVITKTADAISGSRPGARRESFEQYVKRMEDLERVATSFPGVEKAYAIYAGRELRVFVRPTEIDDYAAYNLARNIAKQVEAELTYPGEVKVAVIRETRVFDYAK